MDLVSHILLHMYLSEIKSIFVKEILLVDVFRPPRIFSEGLDLEKNDVIRAFYRSIWLEVPSCAEIAVEN